MLAGLDISSTAAGWAVMDRTGRVEACGTFKPRGDYAARLYAFMGWYHRFLTERQIRVVAIEEPLRSDISKREIKVERGLLGETMRVTRRPITQMTTLRALYGFAAAAQAISHGAGVPYREVNNGDWRQAFIGARRAPKGTPNGTEWLKARAFQQAQMIGARPDSDDAGDAVGVAFWLYGEIAREGRAQRARIAADKVFSRSAA